LRRHRLALSGALLVLLATPCLAQDGRVIFESRCASCHAVAPDAPPMAGPNLVGVLGRRVGSEAEYGYSPALEGAGRAGDAWDVGRLLAFLADPEEMYPGVWMGANGLQDEAERRAVVEWLQSFGP
jgi:cytochrome c